VPGRRGHRFRLEITTHGGRRGTGRDAVEWTVLAAELGAGEVLLNSMDADGTRAGFDTELIRAVRREVSVPVIASGRERAPSSTSRPRSRPGADAVLAASVFHFGALRIGDVKAALAAAGRPGAERAGHAALTLRSSGSHPRPRKARVPEDGQLARARRPARPPGRRRAGRSPTAGPPAARPRRS
jgi:hypothetical protein